MLVRQLAYSYQATASVLVGLAPTPVSRTHNVIGLIVNGKKGTPEMVNAFSTVEKYFEDVNPQGYPYSEDIDYKIKEIRDLGANLSHPIKKNASEYSSEEMKVIIEKLASDGMLTDDQKQTANDILTVIGKLITHPQVLDKNILHSYVV